MVIVELDVTIALDLHFYWFTNFPPKNTRLGVTISILTSNFKGRRGVRHVVSFPKSASVYFMTVPGGRKTLFSFSINMLELGTG